MDHSEALATNASDRYLLGQLSAAEVDAFEEHYFDCATCAEDVRLGMRFLDAGRRLVRETAEEPASAPVVSIDSPPRRRFLQWVPAAAAAALLAANGGAWMIRLQSAAPVFATAASLSLETNRAPGEQNMFPAGAPILFDIPFKAEGPSYTSYDVKLLDAGGEVVQTRRYTESETAAGLSVTIPKPGRYQLVIVGIEPAGQFNEIARRELIVSPAETEKGQPQ